MKFFEHNDSLYSLGAISQIGEGVDSQYVKVTIIGDPVPIWMNKSVFVKDVLPHLEFINDSNRDPIYRFWL